MGGSGAGVRQVRYARGLRHKGVRAKSPVSSGSLDYSKRIITLYIPGSVFCPANADARPDRRSISDQPRWPLAGGLGATWSAPKRVDNDPFSRIAFYPGDISNVGRVP